MDINKVLNKIQELEEKTAQRNLQWKPTVGQHQVRIVPYKHDRDNPFQELYFHYNLAKKTILSPVTFGQPDPVQEFSNKLKTTGDKEDYKSGRALEPKKRTFVPILVRGDEASGVKFWGIGQGVYMKLLKTIADPDYGDITDAVKGRDVVVEYEAAKGPGAYPTTEIRVKPNPTALTSDPSVIALLEKTPEVTSLWEAPTYEELEGYLQAYIEGPSEEETTSEATTTNTSAPAGKVDDAMASFDALFGQK